jgi:hypothetical protein
MAAMSNLIYAVTQIETYDGINAKVVAVLSDKGTAVDYVNDLNSIDDRDAVFYTLTPVVIDDTDEVDSIIDARLQADGV